MPPSPRTHARFHLFGALGLLCALDCALLPEPAWAQHDRDDPYAYRLRTALFPVAFQAGVSQSHFGSAVRAEFDLAPGLGAQISGRLPWAAVAGETGRSQFGFRLGVTWHFEDRARAEKLSGTVYPEDTPAMRGAGQGVDRDLDVPVSSKLGGARMEQPDRDRTLSAPMRKVQSVRLGYDYARAIERARPAEEDGDPRYVLNTMHVAYAGYGWGSHWNLSAQSGGGERELGWRRFYVDLLLTLESWDRTVPLSSAPEQTADFFILGARMGMEGAIDALWRSAEGLGFGYSLELGALPGRSGLEGYLFIGLGLEMDG